MSSQAICSLRRRGGGGWIRTTEAKRNRFTVCPLWPLGNSSICNCWSWWTDSNPRPADYKSAALPTELHQRIRSGCPTARGIILKESGIVKKNLKKFRKKSIRKKRGGEGTGSSAWLYPPLRDFQQLAPVAVCPRCGREQYSYDEMCPMGGGYWCAACAIRAETWEATREI